MATELDKIRLFDLLSKAEKLVTKFSGCHSGKYLSAQEFHKALIHSITKFKEGDYRKAEELMSWFLPTSVWDDFVGVEGDGLGNEICELLSAIKIS